MFHCFAQRNWRSELLESDSQHLSWLHAAETKTQETRKEMNSPRLSFEEEINATVQPIKERLATLFNFYMQVLLFLICFLLVAAYVTLKIYVFNQALPSKRSCGVNKTWPFDNEEFLRNLTRRRQEQLP